MENKLPLISVIVPVYNVEKYLSKCVDSILNQTYENLEIILIDDESPDNCPLICEEYARKERRIRVIHKTNGGLSAARNTGIELARGEYIGFVDSDDYIDKHMYEYLYKAILENEAQLAICSYRRIDSNGTPLPCLSPMKDEVLSSYEILSRMQKKYWWYYITAWNKLYKRELFDIIKFPNGKIHEDVFIMHEVFATCSKIVTIKNELYYYVKRKDSIMGLKRTVKHLDDIEGRYQKYQFYLKKNYMEFLPEFTQELKEIYETERCPIKIEKVRDIRRLIEIDKEFKEMYFSVQENRKLGAYIKYALPGITILGMKIWRKIEQKLNLIRKLFCYAIKVRYISYILIDTPTHGNIGDQAIALAEREFLQRYSSKKRFIELTAQEINFRERYYGKLTPSNKTVFVHGGGFLGVLWPAEEERFRRILQSFRENKVIVMPQTITFNLLREEDQVIFKDSYKIYNNHKNITFFVREDKSYIFMRENMPKVKCELVPDIVMSMKIPQMSFKRENILLCMRGDHEKLITNTQVLEIQRIIETKSDEKIVATDTVIESQISLKERERIVRDKLFQFRKAKLIITDRLHGVIFAALMGTPCIAIDNSNSKVRGIYKWFENVPYISYASNPNEVSKILENVNMNEVYEYDYTVFNDKFLPLINILQKE